MALRAAGSGGQAHVAYVTDAGYAALTVISLHSLLSHRRAPVRVSIFTSGPVPQLEGWLARLARAFPQDRLETVALPELPRRPGTDPKYAMATFQRLAIRPHAEGRITYLDGDTLLFDDVGKLHDSELGGAPMGAVLDYAIRRGWSMSTRRRLFGPKPPPWFLDFRHRHGALVDYARYINTGVLVMDHANRAQDGFFDGLCDVEEAISFRIRNETPFADQDWINHKGGARIAHLDPRWNVFWTARPDKLRALPRAEARQWRAALARPGLVHLTGGGPRPWQTACPEEPTRAGFWRAFHSRLEDSAALVGDELKNYFSQKVTTSS